MAHQHRLGKFTQAHWLVALAAALCALGPAHPQPSAGALHYTVTEGDTLSEIALRFDTSVERIVLTNGISDPDIIRVGQTLAISRYGPAPQAPAPAEPPRAKAATERSEIQSAIHSIVLPLQAGSRVLGFIGVEVSLTQLHSIDQGQLVNLLAGLVRPEILSALDLSQDPDSFLEALSENGIELGFDTRALAIMVEIDPAALVNSGNGGIMTGSSDYTDVVEPEGLSLGLSTAFRMRGQSTDYSAIALDTDWRGFLGIGGRDGLTLTGNGRTFWNDGDTRFSRGRLLAFKDWPDQAIRLSVGDLLPDMPTLSGAPQMLGLLVERDYQELQPDNPGFRNYWDDVLLERESRVTIFLRGLVIEEFDAPAGVLNLRRLNSLDTPSSFRVEVQDAFGRRELSPRSNSGFSWGIPPGASEFMFSVGLLQASNGAAFEYGDNIAALAYWRRGFRNRATLATHVAASEKGWNLGAELFANLDFGRTGLQLAASEQDTLGAAMAVRVQYSVTPGLMGRDRLLLDAETSEAGYRRFADLDAFQAPATSYRASYGGVIGDQTTFHASWSQSEMHDSSTPDRNQVSIAFTRRLFRNYTVTFGVRDERIGENRRHGGFVRLTRSLGVHAISANHDSISRRSRINYQIRPGQGPYGHFGRAALDTTPAASTATLDSRYANSRGEAQAFLTHRWRASGEDRTAYQLQVRTGLAIANGRWGVARDPGNGFALFEGSQDIAGSRIAVGRRSSNAVRAREGRLGAAVLPLRAPHRVETFEASLESDASQALLSEPVVRIRSGSISGIAVIFDNSPSVSLDFVAVLNGSPLALRRGEIECGNESQPIFSSRSGRVFVTGLRPGTCTISFRGLDVREVIINDDAPEIVNPGRIEFNQAYLMAGGGFD